MPPGGCCSGTRSVSACGTARGPSAIADDDGVGRTIEAALLARALLGRGLVKRLAVACPAHLAAIFGLLRVRARPPPLAVVPTLVGRTATARSRALGDSLPSSGPRAPVLGHPRALADH